MQPRHAWTLGAASIKSNPTALWRRVREWHLPDGQGVCVWHRLMSRCSGGVARDNGQWNYGSPSTNCIEPSSRLGQAKKKRSLTGSFKVQPHFLTCRCCSIFGWWTQRSIAGGGWIFRGELPTIWAGDSISTTAGWPICSSPEPCAPNWISFAESSWPTAWGNSSSKRWGSHFTYNDCAVS